MSSPTEEDEKIPADFIHCVQKLLSSVSTLSKHLSALPDQQEITDHNEELPNKLQVRKKEHFFIFMNKRILTLVIFLINLEP